MPPIREHLANVLPEHGEEDLAKRVLTITDSELARIGELGEYYAWSEEAFELGLGMGGTRALCLATSDVLEGNMRELRRTRTSGELQWGLTGAFRCRARPRALTPTRRHHSRGAASSDA
jgi:hypothetical protein